MDRSPWPGSIVVAQEGLAMSNSVQPMHKPLTKRFCLTITRPPMLPWHLGLASSVTASGNAATVARNFHFTCGFLATPRTVGVPQKSVDHPGSLKVCAGDTLGAE